MAHSQPQFQIISIPTIANPMVILPSGSEHVERLLLELINLAESRQIQVVPTGGLTKASMLQLVRRVDPGERLQGVSREDQWPMLRFVRILALGAGLLQVNADALLLPTRQTLAWLQLERGERVRQLLHGWQESDWDELNGIEGVRILARPSDAFYIAKQSIQSIFAQLPDDSWIAIWPFIRQVQSIAPHFLRDSSTSSRWSIRNRLDQPLNGPEYWESVEGLWLHLIVTTTWRWLGLVEVGANEKQEPIAFRLTPLGSILLKGGVLPEMAAGEVIVVQPNFDVLVPPNCLPYARFQLRRIAEEKATIPVAIYRLTRKSILAAMARGIQGSQIERFLVQYAGQALPQNVATSLREWFGEYGRVKLREALILEADAPATLERLRHDKRLQLPEAEAITEHMLVLASGELLALTERIRAAGYGLAVEAEEPIVGEVRLGKRELSDVVLAIECYHAICQELDIEIAINSGLRRRLRKQMPAKAAMRVAEIAGQISSSLQRRLRNA